jgi:Ca-activated chloride channel family protein
VIKALTDDFLQQREGDRVGLVVFGKRAYLHTPLSWDINALRISLAGIDPGLAGRETALGDALALATSRLREQAGSHRVIILLTDGAQTAGELSPRQGAWLAQREGIVIHAVGISATSTAADAAATDEALDASNLRAIAELTGGTYQSGVSTADIQAFYDTIDALEPGTQGSAALRELRELYPWPLALALALSGILVWRRVQSACIQ